MKHILNFIRLDFITIKPYLTLKNLLLILGVSFIVTYANESAIVVIGLFMGFATIYISYPFAVGDQNGIDALYVSLGLKRNHIVSGRYLWSILVDLIAVILATSVSLLLFKVMNAAISLPEVLSISVIMFFLFSLIQATQMPLYFKMGYMKAKTLSYLPFLLIGALTLLGFSLFNNASIPFITSILSWVEYHPLATIFIVIFLWLILLTVSMQISLKFYRNREF